MAKFKQLSKNFLYSFIFLLTSILIASLFSYFNLLNGKILTITQIIICFISIIIGSYKQGKCSSKKGYLEGLKIGFIYTIIFILLNLILYRLFHLKNLIYYILILIVSTFGGMLGISRKKNS